jgi:hypothetical protein
MDTTIGFGERRLRVFCCGHVFRQEREVKLVVHDKTDWQFMCGGTDHSRTDGHFVHVGALINFDSSLDEVAELPPGWEAERHDRYSSWIRTKCGASNG